MFCVNKQKLEMIKVRSLCHSKLQKTKFLSYFTVCNENFDHHQHSSRAYSMGEHTPVLDVRYIKILDHKNGVQDNPISQTGVRSSKF